MSDRSYARLHQLRWRIESRAWDLIKGDPRAFLLNVLPRDSVGAEIGVWKGDFSAKLLRHVQPKRLMLIDPWVFDPNFGDSLFGGLAARSQSDMDHICEGVRARFLSQITQGTVEIHRSKSVDFAKKLPDGSIDWVYIDGNHDYEFVLADLQSWYPKVRPGGLVAGDDYGEESDWWGDSVTRAVMEVVRAEPLVVEVIQNRQYVLRKMP
jgi:hypothetical protein